MLWILYDLSNSWKLCCYWMYLPLSCLRNGMLMSHIMQFFPECNCSFSDAMLRGVQMFGFWQIFPNIFPNISTRNQYNNWDIFRTFFFLLDLQNPVCILHLEFGQAAFQVHNRTHVAAVLNSSALDCKLRENRGHDCTHHCCFQGLACNGDGERLSSDWLTD